MSKNADVVRAQEAIRQLMTAEPVKGDDVATVAAVLRVCGYEVISAIAFDKFHTESLELSQLKERVAPSNPWPFDPGEPVIIDGAIPGVVACMNFDGQIKVQVAYWNNGQMFEAWVKTDRIARPA